MSPLPPRNQDKQCYFKWVLRKEMCIFTRREKGVVETHRQKAPEKGSARRVVGGCGQSRELGDQGSPSSSSEGWGAAGRQ